MLDKRKLLGITGAVLLAFVVLSAVNAPPQNTISKGGGETAAVQTVVFTAREKDDRIAVYADDVLLMETDTRVSSLPKIDRIRLRDGINLYSEKELKQFLQDYCS